jgi:hypothetical protein
MTRASARRQTTPAKARHIGHDGDWVLVVDNSKRDLGALKSAFRKTRVADLCRYCASFPEAEAALKGDHGPVAIVADLDMGEGHQDGARWLVRTVKRFRKAGSGCWGILASRVNDENVLVEAAESADDFRMIPVSKISRNHSWTLKCADYVNSLFQATSAPEGLGSLDPKRAVKDRLFWYSSAMNDQALESMGDLFLMPQAIQDAGAKHGKNKLRPVLMYRGAFYHLSLKNAGDVLSKFLPRWRILSHERAQAGAATVDWQEVVVPKREGDAAPEDTHWIDREPKYSAIDNAFSELSNYGPLEEFYKRLFNGSPFGCNVEAREAGHTKLEEVPRRPLPIPPELLNGNDALSRMQFILDGHCRQSFDGWRSWRNARAVKARA